MSDIRYRQSRIDSTVEVPADDLLEFRRRRKNKLPGFGIFATTLSSKAKLVYCALRSHAWNKQEVWPSLPTIASETSLSRTTVREAIVELDRNGWITVEDQGCGSRPSLYIVHKTPKATLVERFKDVKKSGPERVINPLPSHMTPEAYREAAEAREALERRKARGERLDPNIFSAP
jgi:GntR family transcriptional regulator